MADVQKAVRLGRKARRRRTAKPSSCDVFSDELANEISFRGSSGHDDKKGAKGYGLGARDLKRKDLS